MDKSISEITLAEAAELLQQTRNDRDAAQSAHAAAQDQVTALTQQVGLAQAQLTAAHAATTQAQAEAAAAKAQSAPVMLSKVVVLRQRPEGNLDMRIVGVSNDATTLTVMVTD